MRRALVLLFVLLATSMVGVRPSLAQYGDCTQEYVNSFRVPAHGSDPAWDPGTIRCREFMRVEVETPAGSVTVRVIGDENAEATLPPGGMDAIRRGIERSGEAMQRLDDFDLDYTTILISRPRSSPTDEQPRYGYSTAWTLPGASRDGYGECHVTLFIQTDYTTDETQYAVSHELFHCVQYAPGTNIRAQMATSEALGAWWVEGTAEWFAAYAIGPQPRFARGRQFDTAVAAERALYEMNYQMAVFFYWYHTNHGGPAAMVPFMRAMATSGDAAAQQAAMQSVLDQDAWLQFAKDYDDRNIVYPRGLPVSFGQQPDGDHWNIAESSQHQRELKPFVMALGWAEYACGLWTQIVNEANVQVHTEHSRHWTSFPGELDVRTPGVDRRYRMVAMPSLAGGSTVQRLDVERREACVTCQTSAVIDRCMVGTWEQTGGGPMEFLRRQGIPQVTRDAMGRLVMTLRDDGTYSTRSVPLDYQITIPDDEMPVISDAVGTVGASSGRWSGEGGVLMACIDEDAGATAMTTTVIQGHPIQMPHRSWGMAGTGGSTSYTCDDTTMTTSAPMGNGQNMTYTFRRLTPPPRRR